MNPDALGIIDPIHGFVRAYETEQKLILNPAFQRLRRIRQLSSTHLVYPGAQHTRFEHSLGVMHVAGMAGHALAEKGAIDSEKITITQQIIHHVRTQISKRISFMYLLVLLPPNAVAVTSFGS